jgi:hypothetical protein
MAAWFKQFWRGRRSQAGNVMLLFALGAPLVVGAAGLAIETTYWSYKSLHLQGAADAAAHAAALEKRGGGSNAEVTSVAATTAGQDGYNSATDSIQVNTPPLSGPSAGGQGVEVIIHSPTKRFLTALFINQDLVLGARAVATFNTASNACILALNTQASKAALFSGNTNVTLDGCSVMSNSSAVDAVTAQGSSTLSTDCLISAGGVSTSSNVTMTQCSSAVTQAPIASDPFADVANPTPTGNCLNSNGANLNAGRYCSGLNLSGNVNLKPGVYYLTGDLKVNSNANITGTGVTIFLASGSHVSINGNATVQLSAPTTGTYAGILMMGDRNGVGGKNIVNGTAASQLTGAIYFAKDEVDYLGNFSGTNGCTQVVADTVQWSGSTQIAADCTGLGLRTIPAYVLVRLTE